MSKITTAPGIREFIGWPIGLLLAMAASACGSGSLGSPEFNEPQKDTPFSVEDLEPVDLSDPEEHIVIEIRAPGGALQSSIDFNDGWFEQVVTGAGPDATVCTQVMQVDGNALSGAKCGIRETYELAAANSEWDYEPAQDVWRRRVTLFDPILQTYHPTLIAATYRMFWATSDGAVNWAEFALTGNTGTTAEVVVREGFLADGDIHGYQDIEAHSSPETVPVELSAQLLQAPTELPQNVRIETLHAGDAPIEAQDVWVFYNKGHTLDRMDGYLGLVGSMEGYLSFTAEAVTHILSQPVFAAYRNYIRVERVSIYDDGSPEVDARRLIKNFVPQADKTFEFNANRGRSYAQPYISHAMIFSFYQSRTDAGTVLHELLHLYALSDEYGISHNTCYLRANNSIDRYVGNPDKGTDDITKAPWARWSDEAGIFLTGGSCPNGKYVRPYSRDIMKVSSNSDRLKGVHREQVIRSLYKGGIRPIVQSTPAGTYDRSVGQIWASPMNPVGHDIALQWYVDGNPVSTAATTSITVDEIGDSGTHEVVLVATDPNEDMFRDEYDRERYLTQELSWTVSLDQDTSPPPPSIALSSNGFGGYLDNSFEMDVETIYIEVSHGGISASACVEFQMDDGTSNWGYCDDMNNFASMDNNNDWSFDEATDLWRHETNLAEPNYYAPGQYRISWRNEDTGLVAEPVIYEVLQAAVSLPAPVVTMSSSRFGGGQDTSFELGVDTIFIVVSNAGADATACIEFDLANVSASNWGDCGAVENFTVMSNNADWTFDSSKNAWRSQTDLSQPTPYLPGTYRMYWRNPDSGLVSSAVTYDVFEAAPAPAPAPSVELSSTSFGGPQDSSFTLGADQIYFLVHNAGANALGCVEYDLTDVAASNSGYCDDLANFTVMSGNDDWSFDASAGVWRSHTDLTQTTSYQPGTYKMHWRNPDSGENSPAVVYEVL